MKKLHLGCGLDYREGWVNVDSHAKADVKWDLNKFPYPFKENTFDYIYCSQIIEHLDPLEKVMEELHRILKKGGKVEIKVPYFRSSSAFIFGHKTFFIWGTFDFFTDGKLLDEHNPDFRPLFLYVKRKLQFRKVYRLLGISLFARFFPQIYEDFFSQIFPAGGYEVILEKK